MGNGTQGLASTGRKSVNASRISGTSNSVLSERVHRISEKINEIHVSNKIKNYIKISKLVMSIIIYHFSIIFHKL